MIILSFIIDGVASLILSSNLFTLTALSLGSYYMKEDTLFKYALIIGIIYDIAYTNTLILNGIIFLLTINISLKYNKRFNYNLPNLMFLNLINITIYLFITYFILTIYTNINFDINLVFLVIKSYLVNTIYLIIIYFIMHKKLHHS